MVLKPVNSMRDKQEATKQSAPVPPPTTEVVLFPEEKDVPPAAQDHSDVQVGGDAVESLIAEKRIGLRIRALRQKSSLGLAELGRHTGLSSSFLSQLETGRVVPTLRNLARIAMVFSKDLNYFFSPIPLTLFRVHRAADRVRLPQSGVEDPRYYFESLGYLVPDRQLDPYLAEFQPGKFVDNNFHQHGGFEFLYVMKGSLTIQHGETVHELRTGDSVYFDSSTIHSYTCLGDEPATALIVTLLQPINLATTRLAASRLSGNLRAEPPVTRKKIQ
jgi:quercetin dioxygenase-like cupin family protein/DNA-binding XRE family transcriptional regulator